MTDDGRPDDGVVRAVGGTGDERTVVVTRPLAADGDDVWGACTSADRIPRWFLPVGGELRPGGRYQLQGHAGGLIERCDPPRSFAATWEFGGQAGRIAVTLAPGPGGGTALTLEHTVPVDDHWHEFGPGAVGVGWEMGLLGLAGHLGAAGVPTPGEAAAWSASAEGRAFVTASSDGWCAAHVASGVDAQTARAAADRTTAAYTAVPDPAP